MEKEVSNTVELAVTLVVISIVLGLVFFTVTLGESLRVGAHEFAVDTKTTTSEFALEELVDNEVTEMPAATAYTILRKYSNSIDCFGCYYCAATEGKELNEVETNLSNIDSICLVSHLSGKVKVLAYKNGEGVYRVYIHSINCADGGYTNCTCSNYSHLAECPAKYSNTAICRCSDLPHEDLCPSAHRGLCNCNCLHEDAWRD